jgi:hypothetical protein
MMERTKVKSSMIASIGYDDETERLEVEFAPKTSQQSGAVYQYLEVDPATAAAFSNSESLGQYFSSKISGKFKFERVAEPVAKEETVK